MTGIVDVVVSIALAVVQIAVGVGFALFSVTLS